MKKAKIYHHLRIEDFKLHKETKVRAAKEGRTAIQVVEQALREYLKKPVAK